LDSKMSAGYQRRCSSGMPQSFPCFQVYSENSPDSMEYFLKFKITYHQKCCFSKSWSLRLPYAFSWSVLPRIRFRLHWAFAWCRWAVA
jgi:hypothetical protein